MAGFEVITEAYPCFSGIDNEFDRRFDRGCVIDAEENILGVFRWRYPQLGRAKLYQKCGLSCEDTLRIL
jgi:hypothetical protein